VESSCLRQESYRLGLSLVRGLVPSPAIGLQTIVDPLLGLPADTDGDQCPLLTVLRYVRPREVRQSTDIEKFVVELPVETMQLTRPFRVLQ
jgi:hypothetical protein